MEEEDKKSEQSINSKVEQGKKSTKQKSKFISNFKKVLAVPILGKIVMGLIILAIIAFLLAGTVSFFQNMPNMVRDRLSEIISGDSNWEKYVDVNSDISQQTLITAAMDLMYKGYDLENYGFVNNEVYGYSGQDKIEYKDDKRKSNTINKK